MNKKFCKRLIQLRKQANLSQKNLAERVGVTQKAVDFWEKGINEPKLSYIIELAILFGVTSDYLLGLED